MAQVDGFRFDIMGHLMVSTMKTAQAALAALTPAQDGVNGGAIYVYGEAWDFGEARTIVPFTRRWTQLRREWLAARNLLPCDLLEASYCTWHVCADPGKG